jgi:hypothetical protein
VDFGCVEECLKASGTLALTRNLPVDDGFNYDRSLEHFLFTALKYSSGKSDDECAGKLKTIPIIHLHGDLGALPHTGAALARPYNSNISPEVWG